MFLDNYNELTTIIHHFLTNQMLEFIMAYSYARVLFSFRAFYTMMKSNSSKVQPTFSDKMI